MDKNGVQTYKVRYRVDEWNGPVPKKIQTDIPGIAKSGDPHWGYSDEILVASIILDNDQKIASILLMDTVGGLQCDRRILEAVRDQINHHLEHHTPKAE